MSIFNKLQKALGFSYEDEGNDSIEGLVSATVHASLPHDSAVPVTLVADHLQPLMVENERSEAPAQDKGDPDITMILDGVVKFMNQQLPPYIKDNLNLEGQRKYLFDSLDTSLRQYLKDVAENERQRIQQTKEQERDKLKKNFDEAREKIKAMESQLSTETEKSMSGERQKRALTSRIKDLEEKIASLEAEREQYDLENRSLQNKLRVAEVHQANFQASIDSLQKECSQLKERYDEANKVIEELRMHNEQLSLSNIAAASIEGKSNENDAPSSERSIADDIVLTPGEMIAFSEEEEHEAPKHEKGPVAEGDKKELVADMGWLVEADNERPIPEAVTTPGGERDDDVQQGPAQLSLW